MGRCRAAEECKVSFVGREYGYIAIQTSNKPNTAHCLLYSTCHGKLGLLVSLVTPLTLLLFAVLGLILSAK